MPDPVQKPARVQRPKDAPYQIFKLLPYVDTILDTISGKDDKKARSNDLFAELKDSRQKAKEEYEKQKAQNVQGRALLVYKNEFDYLDTVLANCINLINSFETMQTVWHLKTNEISTFYESKIGAGGFMTNFKRFVPWLFTPVVVLVSAITGAWGDVHQLITDAFTKWQWGMVNMAKLASDALGLSALVWGSTRINQGANNWVHKIRKERDSILRHFFVQESDVRKAIRDTVQQIALGLSAEFGYTNELKRADDQALVRATGDLTQIWKIVSERVKEIQKTLPRAIQELFASSLELPDYVANLASQLQPKDTKQQEQNAGETKS